MQPHQLPEQTARALVRELGNPHEAIQYARHAAQRFEELGMRPQAAEYREAAALIDATREH